MASHSLLYRMHELAFRTQYAELKERTPSNMPLLPGTPGMLVKRSGTGYTYWYRVYYPVPGTTAEQLVGKEEDSEAMDEVARQIEFAQWTLAQVRNLRKLDFQVADKGAASVLVELHNKGMLGAGLTLVGTLCYMAWLNELGARAVSARTQDIDLAARQKLKLAAPESFLEAMNATRLGFSPIPGMPSQAPSTSVKLKGRDGLRVDVLAHGEEVGKTVPIPQLMWHAQTVPYYAYLLDQPRQAAVLAGGHCIPLLLPQPERFVWHKLYSGASRQSFPEKAEKDLMQAATLAAILVEQQDEVLSDSFEEVPTAMQKIVKARLPALRRSLTWHPQTLEQFELTLG
jgi:hypothetical protein